MQKVYSPKMPSISVDSVLNRFRRVGALLEGHFRLTSGLHSSGYLQCALVLQHPREAEACGQEIAAKVGELNPQVVLSPALGGIVIGQEVGRALGVRAIFAERQDGKLMLRRGFSLEPGERVLVRPSSVRQPSSIAAGANRTWTFRFTPSPRFRCQRISPSRVRCARQVNL